MRKKPRKKKPSSEGTDLFNQVISLTGIPAQSIRRELKAILERKDIDIDQLTIDQLRTVVASYLREIMSGLLDRYNHRKSEVNH